jgi:hypothetical protein
MQKFNGELMLHYVHPDALYDVWPFIKEGLTRIHDRATDRWLVEDVYHGIKSNGFSLHIVNDREGFVLLQPTRGWDGPELFVFAAYIVPGHDVMDEAFDEVKRIGKSMGAKRIKFQSKRQGWAKRAEQLGYAFGHVEYEITI